MPELRGVHGNYVNECVLPVWITGYQQTISYIPVSKAYEIQGHILGGVVCFLLLDILYDFLDKKLACPASLFCIR